MYDQHLNRHPLYGLKPCAHFKLRKHFRTEYTALAKTQNCVSFLVTDNYNASSEEEVRREAVNIDTWLHRKDVAASFKCHQIIQNGFLTPRYVN